MLLLLFYFIYLFFDGDGMVPGRKVCDGFMWDGCKVYLSVLLLLLLTHHTAVVALQDGSHRTLMIVQNSTAVLHPAWWCPSDPPCYDNRLYTDVRFLTSSLHLLLHGNNYRQYIHKADHLRSSGHVIDNQRASDSFKPPQNKSLNSAVVSDKFVASKFIDNACLPKGAVW